MCVLPRAQEAWVPERKILRYLLNLNHTEGWSKAQFFLGQGFAEERWRILEQALRRHASTGIATFVRRQHALDYWRVLGVLATPSGKRPLVFSVWVVENDGAPRFVSAYPR